MRIATSFIHQQANADIQRAQVDLFEAQRQAGSERKAADLKGYERDAVSLIAARGFHARAQSYIDAGAELENRLTTQDLALGQAAEAGQDLRMALTEALALEKGTELMSRVDLVFSQAVSSMNMTYAGRYVFSGISDDTPPVNVTTLAALEAAVTVDDIFDNATRKVTAEVDPRNRMEIAPLANDASRELFASLKRIKEFETANGPFNGPLTTAQRAFIEAELTTVVQVAKDLNGVQAENGGVQKRVEKLVNRQGEELDFYAGLVGGIERVDLAEVSTKIAQAQLQMEASARVYGILRDATLLNYLR